MYAAMQAGWNARLIRHPTQPTRCIIIRDVDLVVNDEGTSAKEAVEEMILRLRIFKSGGVSFDFGVIDQVGWYDDPTTEKAAGLKLFGVFFYVSWAHHGMPGLFQINETEVEALRTFIATTSTRRLMDDPACRYLFQSYHEPYASDRFLKNAIGLEALLVGDVQDTSNIQYKFVDRGCFLLNRAQPNPGGAAAYTASLAAIYERRSRLVHASKTTARKAAKDQDTLRLSEEYLRVLLRHLLRHPELNSAVSIDHAKRALYR
jgi:hypothetical protein